MNLSDSVMNGVLYADRDGHLVLLSPAAQQLTGVSGVGVVGTELAGLRGRSELLDSVIDDVERIGSGGGSGERVVEVHHTERDIVYIRIGAHGVADLDGHPAGVLAILEDVTSHHKTDQLRNQYLSIVAHELRTPLTGIKTFATMLAQGKLGALQPRQQEVLESIREQSIRLEHQIDKLVNLGFIDAADYGQDLALIDLADTVRSAIVPLLQPARAKSITIDLGLPAEPLLARADRSGIRRVVQALVENAVKFTPDGGRVEVSVGAADGVAVVAVGDTGIGIEPRYHRRIFEQFFQVEDPLTRHHGGAGLGLFVAKGIVEAHGSKIEVVSRLGEGAKFSFGLRLEGETVEERVVTTSGETRECSARS